MYTKIASAQRPNARKDNDEEVCLTEDLHAVLVLLWYVLNVEFVGWNPRDGEPRHFSSAVTVQRESPLRKGVATRSERADWEIALEMPIRVSKEHVHHGSRKHKDEMAAVRAGRLDTQKVMVA
jgi:hypothetical protein